MLHDVKAVLSERAVFPMVNVMSAVSGGGRGLRPAEAAGEDMTGSGKPAIPSADSPRQRYAWFTIDFPRCHRLGPAL